MLANVHARLSLRQLGRAAGISHQTCVRVLASLEKRRLVEVVRIGKTVTASLNESHAIISELILPLLDRERRMVDDVGRDIHRQFGPLCRKIVQKDVVTGVGTVQLLAADEHLPAVRRLAEEMAAGLEERYGFEVEFRVHGFSDAPLEIV